MDVTQDQRGIAIRLEPKPGERLTTTEMAACLDYTIARVDEAR